LKLFNNTNQSLSQYTFIDHYANPKTIEQFEQFTMLSILIQSLKIKISFGFFMNSKNHQIDTYLIRIHCPIHFRCPIQRRSRPHRRRRRFRSLQIQIFH
jgi:hypothetical protein